MSTPEPSALQLGNGGEHYVAAMLNLHGISCATLPAGWPGYDLIAETDEGAQRIQVKTKHEQKQEWQKSNSMKFWEPGETAKYNWLALVLWNPETQIPRVWLIPSDIADLNRHTSKTREMLFATVEEKLSMFENNWTLSRPEI